MLQKGHNQKRKNAKGGIYTPNNIKECAARNCKHTLFVRRKDYRLLKKNTG